MIKTKDFGKVLQENDRGSVYRQWLITVLVNTTTLSYGLQMGWVSPMTKILKSDASPVGAPLTDSHISIIASGICLFAVVGVPIYIYIADTYGRRLAIFALVVPQFLSWVLILLAPNVETVILARLLCGLAAGGCFNVIPIYVKEIAQDNIRGFLGSLITVFQNVGVFCMFALGAYLNYFTVIWIVIWLPVVSLPFLLRIPESPAYLIKVGKAEEATLVIAYLRGLHPDHRIVKNEIEIIKEEDLYFKSIPNMSLKTIFKEKAWRRGFIMMMCLMSAHGLNGGVTITSYAVSLLAASGVTVGPELQSLSLPIVMIVSSTVTMSAVDRFGRKPILYLTWIVGSGCFIAMGSIVLLQYQGHPVSGWWTIAAMIGIVAAYAGGVSPMPYVIMSEMFNFQIRAKFMGCIVMWAWFLCFLQLIIFEAISKTLGQYTAFYLFAVVNVFGGLITMLFPETKGKSVDQIETELKKK